MICSAISSAGTTGYHNLIQHCKYARHLSCNIEPCLLAIRLASRLSSTLARKWSYICMWEANRILGNHDIYICMCRTMLHATLAIPLTVFCEASVLAASMHPWWHTTHVQHTLQAQQGSLPHHVVHSILLMWRDGFYWAFNQVGYSHPDESCWWVILTRTWQVMVAVRGWAKHVLQWHSGRQCSCWSWMLSRMSAVHYVCCSECLLACG